jgi:hypothetical protein
LRQFPSDETTSQDFQDKAMTRYNWVLHAASGSSSGEGDVADLTKAVDDADLSGVAPADWIVDMLLADGFENGEAVHRHEGNDSWMLSVRPLGKNESP